MLVSEIADLTSQLAAVVKNTREIVETANDGRKLLASRHPQAQQDFSELLRQMQVAIEGLAQVTKLVSAFRFVISYDERDLSAADRELRSFNDDVIAQQADVARLKGQIRKLKANCDKVRELRDKLDASTESRSWGGMFRLFGTKAQPREVELSQSLSGFYADDQQMSEPLTQTLQLAERALQDVDAKLGPPGSSNPYNVPSAAALLGLYAVQFRTPQDQLRQLADASNQARMSLQS